ncbi:MAG: hypothetical protein ACP5GA_09745 [Acidithiobacillus sp.]
MEQDLIKILDLGGLDPFFGLFYPPYHCPFLEEIEQEWILRKVVVLLLNALEEDPRFLRIERAAYHAFSPNFRYLAQVDTADGIAVG